MYFQRKDRIELSGFLLPKDRGAHVVGFQATYIRKLENFGTIGLWIWPEECYFTVNSFLVVLVKATLQS